MDTFLSFWGSFAGKLLELLPRSPVVDSAALATLSTYAGYINYFIPVGGYLKFFSAFLVSLSVYYSVMTILRFMRLIK